MGAGSKVLLANARLVNEGAVREVDVLVDGDRIGKIQPQVTAEGGFEVVDLDGRYLLPGLIDDQVHFREPGLTHKGSLATESRAAICGGVTSVMEMPNTAPAHNRSASVGREAQPGREAAVLQTTPFTSVRLTIIWKRFGESGAQRRAGSRYSWEPPPVTCWWTTRPHWRGIFADAPLPVATHCEDTPTILANEARFRARYGDAVPMSAHPLIRSAEACYQSSSLAVELASRHGTRLHVLHLTTARELELFEPGPLAGKRITAEACVHHLWFDESRYADLGTRIKCNPAIKTRADRDGLLQGLLEGRIDVIATDHAPHTLEEKSRPYFEAPAGLPLVQHSLQMLMECHLAGKIPLTSIPEKAAHNPAVLFGIADRGFVREGYFADLVVVDVNESEVVTPSGLEYKCGWSPLEGQCFSSRIYMTMLNGELVFQDGRVASRPSGRHLEFVGE